MRIGEVITAEVLSVDDNWVVVNAGLKSESIIPAEEFRNDSGQVDVKPGDFTSVSIEALEDGFRRHAPFARQGEAHGGLARAREGARDAEKVKGVITGKVKGGLTVMTKGIRAFLPGLAGRPAAGEGHHAVRRQGDGVQGHQARPQAQQRGRVAPRRARGDRGRRARAALASLQEGAPSRASSRTSPTTARSWISAASTACCTSPTSRGGA
jgi:small subunit ribosomal protein S1